MQVDHGIAGRPRGRIALRNRDGVFREHDGASRSKTLFGGLLNLQLATATLPALLEDPRVQYENWHKFAKLTLSWASCRSWNLLVAEQEPTNPGPGQGKESKSPRGSARALARVFVI